MSDTTSELRLIDITADLIRNMIRENQPFINIAMEIDKRYAAQKQRWEAAARKDELKTLKRERGFTTDDYSYIEERIAALDGVIGQPNGT